MITNRLLNNPYRILGVYSNSPKKDVLSNLNKMKAFLKVGKAVPFPLDIPALLPPVNRNESAASNALASIEVPMDQLKHALFWFMKETPFDDIAFKHLFSGDIAQAKEIWGKKENVSSLLNLMACSMIEEDTSSLAINADTLFQKHSEELCLSINETLRMTSEELTKLFVKLLKDDDDFDIAKLMQIEGTSSQWRNATGIGIVKPIIDKMEFAISEAKGMKGANANYNAGVKLMNSTKENLTQLKNILGATDMQYQMIADKLATTILQCGINYFNYTEEDTAVEKALTLQNYAYTIAVGQLAKDRCKENVDSLRKIGPEYKAHKEIKRTIEKLKGFSAKSSRNSGSFPHLFSNSYSISEIDEFIENCKPDLTTICQKLGSSNSVYINISSAVAQAAINALVNIINDEQLLASIESYRDYFKKEVASAVSTMSKIKSLDMTKDCRNYFNNNYSTLTNINSKLNPSGCYIATMAYGYYDHPQVIVLRQFRDSYLSHRDWGRKFISFYYAHSPHWVEVLKGHRLINAVIRKLLDSFIYIWKKTSYYE